MKRKRRGVVTDCFSFMNNNLSKKEMNRDSISTSPHSTFTSEVICCLCASSYPVIQPFSRQGVSNKAVLRSHARHRSGDEIF